MIQSDTKGKRTLKYCLVFCLLISCTTIAQAEDGSGVNCPERQATDARLHDEVWLLSCRSLACPEQGPSIDAETLTEGLAAWKYNLSDQQWDRSKMLDFLHSSEDCQTVVWVHGNLTTASEAFATGLTVYRQLVRDTEIHPPIRFIIWSWPASKILSRPVPDARIKAARTTWAGIRLAGMLQQIPGHKSVGLIGFSFGAQVVSAALEIIAGGELNHTKIVPQGDRVSYRVTFFAAALDSYWLLPDRRFGKAFDVIDSLTLINNYCDWVLKHYGKLYCHCARRGPSALGYTGLPEGNFSREQKEKIRQFNASGSVGKQHAWRAYIQNRSTMDLIREGTLPDWQDNPKQTLQVSTVSQ